MIEVKMAQIGDNLRFNFPICLYVSLKKGMRYFFSHCCKVSKNFLLCQARKYSGGSNIDHLASAVTVLKGQAPVQCSTENCGSKKYLLVKNCASVPSTRRFVTRRRGLFC